VGKGLLLLENWKTDTFVGLDISDKPVRRLFSPHGKTGEPPFVHTKKGRHKAYPYDSKKRVGIKPTPTKKN
jgi:hypothetical protein